MNEAVKRQAVLGPLSQDHTSKAISEQEMFTACIIYNDALAMSDRPKLFLAVALLHLSLKRLHHLKAMVLPVTRLT